MISDEVQMLINRMRSNPEEFTAGHLEFGDRYEVRNLGKWDNLMNSIVNRKPDIETIFTSEEIQTLRETAFEILRPIALGSIVKTIVGGDSETNLQMEMKYTHTPAKITLTRADLLKLQVEQAIKRI
jgi:hypothetical protein